MWDPLQNESDFEFPTVPMPCHMGETWNFSFRVFQKILKDDEFSAN